MLLVLAQTANGEGVNAAEPPSHGRESEQQKKGKAGPKKPAAPRSKPVGGKAGGGKGSFKVYDLWFIFCFLIWPTPEPVDRKAGEALIINGPLIFHGFDQMALLHPLRSVVGKRVSTAEALIFNVPSFFMGSSIRWLCYINVPSFLMGSSIGWLCCIELACKARRQEGR